MTFLRQRFVLRLVVLAGLVGIAILAGSWLEGVSPSGEMELNYLFDRPDRVLDVTIEHVYITIVTILGASVVGVVFGVLITRIRSLYNPILTLAGIIYTVPSLAMFVLMIPLLGIGFRSAVVALILYSLLIIIRNTAVGLDGVDPNIIEAARGMGMTALGILFRVELPLALPIIFAGIRIAAVSTISLATIAAFIGAGGIGDLIFEGLSSQRDDKIIAGAIAASVMALGAEVLLRQVEQGSSPGVTGDFKTLGERIADFWDHLREHPDTLVMFGTVLLLIGYSGMAWIHPYSYDERISGAPEVQAALDEAGYLELTGLDLAMIDVDTPVVRSLQILPWFAIAAALMAVYNTLRGPGSRASAELFLICGLLAFFPLMHFYFETKRAVGDYGAHPGDLFFGLRDRIKDISGVRISPVLEEVNRETGFTLSAVGVAIIVVGAFMKSLWFRRRTRERLEEEAAA